MKKVLFYALTTLLVTSVQGQTTLTDQLIQEKIEKFYPQTPDSAIYYLKASLKTLPKAEDSLATENLIKLGLSFSLQQEKDSVEYYFEQALFSANNHPQLKGNVYQKWGKTYRDFGQYAMADSVLTIADSLFRESGYLTGTGMVLVERATINHYTSNIKKAIEELEKAIKIFKAIDDRKHLLIAQMELAASYLMSNDYAFAKDLYAELLPALEKEKGLNYYFTLVNYGDVNFQLEEWEKADEKYTIAYEYFKESQLEQFEFYVLSKLAMVSHKSGDLNKAARQFKEAFDALMLQNSPRLQQVASFYIELLRELDDYITAGMVLDSVVEYSYQHTTKLNTNNDISFLEQATEVFKRNQRYAEALAAAERIVYLKDSLHEVTNEKATKEVEAKFQNQYFRQHIKTLTAEKKYMAEKTKRNRLTIGLLGVILLLIVISSYTIYRKNKERIILKEKNLRESIEKVKALKEKNELQKKLIEERQNNLAIKNRELISLSLQLADTNNQIEDILQNGARKNLHPVVFNKLKSISRNENYWKLFHKRFNHVHPDFEEELQENFPQFNNNNIEFCKLLKLKLDNKEIAKLLGISPQSVITRKYRLKKKLKSEEEELLLDEILS